MIFTLNERQMDAVLFPVSCRVMALDMDITGIVKMVQIDLNSAERQNLYVLEHLPEDQPISENFLSFAPTCKVWFDGSKAGTILLTHRPPWAQCVLYSVALDDGGLHHGISSERLKFRNERALSGGVVTTKSSSSLQTSPAPVNDSQPALSPHNVVRDPALNCVIFMQLPSSLSFEHIQTHLNREKIKNCPYIQIFLPNQSRDPACPKHLQKKLHICLASRSMSATSGASRVIQEQLGDSLADSEKAQLQSRTMEWDVCLETEETPEVQTKVEETAIAPSPTPSRSSRIITISNWIGTYGEKLKVHMQRARNFLECQTDCTIITTLVDGETRVAITGEQAKYLTRAGRFVENSILSQIGDVSLHRRILYEMAQKPGEDVPVYQRPSKDREEMVWMSIVGLPHPADNAVDAITEHQGISAVFRDTGCRVDIEIRNSFSPFVYLEGASFAQVEKAEAIVIQKMMAAIERTSLVPTGSENKRTPGDTLETTERIQKRQKTPTYHRDYDIPSWFSGFSGVYSNLRQAIASLETHTGYPMQISRETDENGISLVRARLIADSDDHLEQGHHGVVDRLLSVVCLDIRGSYPKLVRGRLRYMWSKKANGEAVEQPRGIEVEEYHWLLIIDLRGKDITEVGAVLGIDGKKKKTLERQLSCYIFMVPHSSPFIFVEGQEKVNVEAVGRLIQKSIDKHEGKSAHAAISLL